jgi:hypothetical protein
MVAATPERGGACVMRLPETVVRFLDEYHAGGVTERDCRACSSPCCSLGGFAILENVVQIHELYRRGALRRADYDYEPGLSFAQFVFKYFDVYKKSVTVDGGDTTLMLFHMRALSADGHLVSVPGGDDYWEIRRELFERNPWLNRGCVFLSHKVDNWPNDDGDAGRHCILHAPNSATAVTAKPIDCVFFTCNRPLEARMPTAEQSSTWFQLLAEHFPNSLERFEALIGASASEDHVPSE